MSDIDVNSQSIRERVSRLKTQQQTCTEFLIECIHYREQHPEYAERLDAVIASIEVVMSQNADMLARLESSHKVGQPYQLHVKI